MSGPKRQTHRKRRRRSSGSAKARVSRIVLIAVLIGIGIGVLFGVILTDRREETETEVPQKTEPVISVTEEEPKEETKEEPREEPQEEPKEEPQEEPKEESKEEQEQEEALDPEAYAKYLEEAAAEKSMPAGTVEFLNIPGEMFSELFNASYPKHEYDIGAFSTGLSGWMRYAGTDYVTRDGIDVSQFNGQIDWEKVKAAGVEFTFIRLGYRGYGGGDLCEDPWFEYNLAGAQEAGLDIGIYFFAQAVSEEEAREEAKYVLDKLHGTELQLPIIYDVEPIRTDDARTDDVTGAQFTKNIKAFCEVVEKAGYKAGYYANLKWQIFMLDLNALKDYTAWYAGYADRPQTSYNFEFWQYSDKGKVDGIDADTDLDIQMIPTGKLTEEEIKEARAKEEAEEKAALEKKEAEEKAAREKAEAEEKAAREKAAAEEKAAREKAAAGENTTDEGTVTEKETATEEKPVTEAPSDEAPAEAEG